MEEYRKQLRRRMQIYGAVCGLVPLVLIGVNRLLANAASALNEHDAGFVYGVLTGLIMVFLASTVFGVVRIRKALGDDALLKKMYVAETDERNIFIQNKVGSTGMQIAAFLLVFAAMIACYFNIVVTYSLVGAALGLSLIMLGFKLYYRNKY